MRATFYASGFRGEFCEENIDDCKGVDCKNGQCVDSIAAYTCRCDPGFAGTASLSFSFPFRFHFHFIVSFSLCLTVIGSDTDQHFRRFVSFFSNYVYRYLNIPSRFHSSRLIFNTAAILFTFRSPLPRRHRRVRHVSLSTWRHVS